MGPANANAGRTEWFRAHMGRPATITALVVGASAALLLGAAFGGPVWAALAPLGVIVAVVGGAWWTADRRAENAFWKHVAESLGYQPFFDPHALETTTPLLHAGDRRIWRHELTGPLGDSGLTAQLAQYRYDVKRDNDKGPETWTQYRFTVCLVELEAGMELFKGVYLRGRRGLVGRIEHDWLRGRRLEDVELESEAFNDAYELLVAPEQDRGRLRELFDPRTIVWLAEHPLRPHFEFRAGFLVVYVPGHLEDLGRLVWLLEAAERIAERVAGEISEARSAARG